MYKSIFYTKTAAAKVGYAPLTPITEDNPRKQVKAL